MSASIQDGERWVPRVVGNLLRAFTKLVNGLDFADLTSEEPEVHHGALSFMSSYEGNGDMGIDVMVCSVTRGPTPIRARRSMMGANIARSMVSCWMRWSRASRRRGSRSRDCCWNRSSMSGYPP